MSLVAMCPSKQHTNSKSKNDPYITKLEELGLTNNVRMEPIAAMLTKNTVMNTVISMADRPKKSRKNPMRNNRMPKNNL